MRVLDLFSGIGGFSLGLERAGMETAAFCEYDKKARRVLRKHWPDIPIYEDVRRLNGKQFEGESIDLICGGFPCQPFSTAGKRKGNQDDRHLWPEYFRLIQEIRPRWVLGENVAGLINLGLDEVLSDLESASYSWETFIVPACAINAPHRRDRVWIVAYSRSNGWGRRNNGNEGRNHGALQAEGSSPRNKQKNVADTEEKRNSGPDEYEKCDSADKKNRISRKSGGVCSVMADSESIGSRRIPRTVEEKKAKSQSKNDGAIFNRSSKNVSDSHPDDVQGVISQLNDPEIRKIQGERPAGLQDRTGFWAVEPGMGRVANGVSGRVDRLKQLGNAVVPQVVEIIGRAIMEADHVHR